MITVGLLLYGIAACASLIYTKMEYNWYELTIKDAGKIIFSSLCFFFLMLHWKFSSHYLNGAALFKPSVNNDIDSLRKRKFWLTILEVGVFIFLIAFEIVMIYHIKWEYWAFTEETVWLFCAATITLVTMLSMRHIN